MNLSELKNIISRGEDSCHQFKEDIRNGDSLAAEMVALSNSRGGYILIGISNREACLFNTLVMREKILNASINAPINAPLSQMQKDILAILKMNPKTPYDTLMVELDKNRTTIMRNLRKLKEAGIIRRSGSRKGGSWEILL